MRMYWFGISALAALAAAAGNLLSLQGASAADIPAPVVAPAYKALAPVWTWTGFYLGVQGGYAWGNSSHHQAAADTGNFRISGATAGGTVGYNVQFQNFVVGVEGDGSWAGIKGTTAPGIIGNYGCNIGCETKVNWFGTVRARGGIAFDRALLYATGGWAIGGVSARIIGDEASGFQGSATKSGWTAGGGLEYGFMPNISGKIEYLYTDLGRFTYGQPGTAGDGATATARFNLVRAGLNFRF